MLGILGLIIALIFIGDEKPEKIVDKKPVPEPFPMSETVSDDKKTPVTESEKCP